MKKREYYILGIIAIIVAIILLFVGKGKEKRCTVEIQANIVEVKEKINFDTEKSTSSYTYYPIIEYKIGDKTIRKDCKYLEKEYNTFKKGEKIDILYNPNNVEEFIIPKNKSLVYLAYFIFAFGGIALIYGFLKDDSLMY